MSAQAAVSVLVVNWNAREFLRTCVRSVQDSSPAAEIIVVDNASRDSSAEMLRNEFPKINLIANERNRGFAGGINLAARQAQGRYLLLLNPDTVVPDGAIDGLVGFADAHPEIGAVGPKIVNADGSAQRSCWRTFPGLGMAFVDAFYLWKIPWLSGFTRSEFRAKELQHPRAVAHLLGACMLVRRAAWESVGAFDESYFLFLEETDWCLRAQRANWSVFYFPDVSIVHFGQQSMRLAPTRNIPQFYASSLKFYRSMHGESSKRTYLFKAIIATACVIRIGMWRERARRARDTASRDLAFAMTLGYRQTLSTLESL